MRFSLVNILVPHRDNVRLHSVISGIVSDAPNNDPFVKVAQRAVRHISACREYDGTLFVHRLVARGVRRVLVPVTRASESAIGPRAVVHGGQSALRRVSTLEREPVGAPPEVKTHKRVS